MIDINLIRSNPDAVKASLKKKECDVDFSELLSWDDERRALISDVESLKARKNKVSAVTHFIVLFLTYSIFFSAAVKGLLLYENVRLWHTSLSTLSMKRWILSSPLSFHGPPST